MFNDLDAAKTMKIAIISDIHGNLPALQAVLAEIDAAGVDCIINVGDTLGGPHARYTVAEQTAAGWQIDLRCAPGAWVDGQLCYKMSCNNQPTTKHQHANHYLVPQLSIHATQRHL